MELKSPSLSSCSSAIRLFGHNYAIWQKALNCSKQLTVCREEKRVVFTTTWSNDLGSIRTLVTFLCPWIGRFTMIISAWWLRTSSKFQWTKIWKNPQEHWITGNSVRCRFLQARSSRDVRSHSLWLRIVIRNFYQYPNSKPYPKFILAIRILIRKLKKCKLIKT